MKPITSDLAITAGIAFGGALLLILLAHGGVVDFSGIRMPALVMLGYATLALGGALAVQRRPSVFEAP